MNVNDLLNILAIDWILGMSGTTYSQSQEMVSFTEVVTTEWIELDDNMGSH